MQIRLKILFMLLPIFLYSLEANEYNHIAKIAEQICGRTITSGHLNSQKIKLTLSDLNSSTSEKIKQYFQIKDANITRLELTNKNVKYSNLIKQKDVAKYNQEIRKCKLEVVKELLRRKP